MFSHSLILSDKNTVIPYSVLVPEAAYTVVILLMMGAGSTRNM